MGVMKKIYEGGRGMGESRGAGTFIEVSMFFDKPAVMLAVDKAALRVFSRFGAFVRKTARRSIRKPRKKRVAEFNDFEKIQYRKTGYRPLASSEPGKPPRNQTGRLKDTIFFWYDRNEQSVIIGPSHSGGFDRMGALEHGGLTMSRKRAFHIRARPFMRPALAKELPKLDKMWHHSIRTSI